MMDLIRTAWGIEADGVYGGPNWLETDRFDVIAKAAPASSEADRALMLRALLAERFGLAVHHDEKPVPVFALGMGKKRSPQLKEAGAAGEGVCKPNVGQMPPYSITLECHNIAMTALAQSLRRWWI